MDLYPVIPQALFTTSSPTFAGATIGSTSAMLKRVAGVLTDAVAGVDYLASYTETDPVVKALTGIIKSSGSAIGTVTVNSPLDYTTGTLSIPAAATAQNGYITSTNWNTFNGKADYSFGANNFSGTGTFTGGTGQHTYLGVGIAPSTSYLISASGSSSSSLSGGQNLNWSGIYGAGNISLLFGLSFIVDYAPTGLTAIRHATSMYGCQGNIKVESAASSTYANYVTNAYNFYSNFTLAIGAGGATPYITNAFCYYAATSTVLSPAYITTLYAFYDYGQTAGNTNWGFYGLSAQNYMSGSLDAGSYKCGGTAPCADGVHTPVVSITTKGGIITAIS